MIKKMAFTVYPVSNVNHSRDFYETILGLKVSENWENQWIEYYLGNATFAISSMLEENEPGAKGAMIALEVDDLEGFVKKLKSNSVRILKQPFATPVCKMSVISDPDGNGIILHELT
jgi:predicted enzyme related to lactoylglutathione lyase